MKWDEAIHSILQSFYEQSVGCTWTHNRTAQIYSDSEIAVALPRIMLSGLVSSGALCLEYVKNETYKSYALLVLAAIGAINGLVGSIQVFYGYGEKAGVHRTVAMAWAELSKRIELVLRKHIEDRPDASEFLEQVNSDFKRLQESSLPIPSRVIAAFKKENKKWIDDKREVPFYANGLHELILLDEGGIHRAGVAGEESKEEIEVVQL